jgi:hypothetical protein
MAWRCFALSLGQVEDLIRLYLATEMAWRIGFVFLYDTTSGSITQSATEPEVVRVFISANNGPQIHESVSSPMKKMRSQLLRLFE